MTERTADHALWQLERDRVELQAERAATSDPVERRAMHAQLRQVEAAIARMQAQAESLACLPTIWARIYGDGPGILALFSGIRADGRLRAPRTSYHDWPGDAASAAYRIEREEAAGREVYHCAHLLTYPRRRKEYAAPLAALYVDLDHDYLPESVPAPTLIVESSPGKLQCYWRLVSPIAPLVGEELNRRLAHAVQADPSGYDLTQLLRVPGTTNQKYGSLPLVRLRAITNHCYDATLLERLLPLVTPPRSVAGSIEHDIGSPAAPAEAPPVPLSAAGWRIWRGEAAKRRPDGAIDRSAALVQIARLLYEAGASETRIVAALAERDVSLGWEKYAGRRDADAQYQRITELIARSPRTRRGPRH